MKRTNEAVKAVPAKRKKSKIVMKKSTKKKGAMLSKKMKKPAILREASVNMTTKQVPISWILENHDACFSDQRGMQRLLNKWSQKTRDEYLDDVLKGAEQKDMINLADISMLVENIEESMKQPSNSTDKQIALATSYQYYNDLLNDNKKYLVIDGQHRLDVIKQFFGAEPGSEQLVLKKAKAKFKVLSSENDYISHSIIDKPFDSWTKELRDYVLNKIQLNISIITKGTVKELKGIFVTKNNGDPVNFFERILIGSIGPAYEYIMNITDHEVQPPYINNYFSKYKKTMKYDVKKRGDAQAYSEELCHIVKGYKSNNTIKRDLMKLYDDCFYLPHTIQKFHQHTLNIRAIGSKNVPKFTNMRPATNFNLFIMLTIMLDKSHPVRKRFEGLENMPCYDVVKGKEGEFVEWFMKREAERLLEDRYVLNDDGTERVDSYGNKMKNDSSYHELCRRSGFKNVTKKQDILLRDFGVWVKHLLKEKIIKVTGGKRISNPDATKVALAVKQGWMSKDGRVKIPFGKLHKYQAGHVVAINNGGTEEDGVKLVTAIANIRESDN